MDSREKYLQKIREMGILRKESEMPKRKIVTEEDKLVAKSGRLGFEPAGSKYSTRLHQKSKQILTPEVEISREFEGIPFDPETYKKKENEVLKDIDKIKDEETKKKYLEELYKRMRTA